MIRNASRLVVVLVVLGGLAIGCSDDTVRITSPEQTTAWDNILATGADDPGITFDVEEYILGQYSEPDDSLLDEDLGESSLDDLGHPSDDDVVSEKDLAELDR